MARLIVPGGTKPYSYSIINPDNQVVLSGAGVNDDYVEFDNSYVENYPRIKYTVTDASSKQVVRYLDRASAVHLKRYPKMISVTNGNVDNHLAQIAAGIRCGMNITGVVIGQSDAMTDSALALYESGGHFDHTQPITGNPVKQFDKVVRACYITSPGNTRQALEARHCLKISIDLSRESNTLNDGGNITQFYGNESLALRPDGSLAYHYPSGVVPRIMIPSYASTIFRAWAGRYVKAIINRYLYAILDGTIMSIGFVTTSNAESEYSNYTNADGSTLTTQGDFHPEMVAKFKADYPAYAGLSNGQIAAEDDTSNSAVRRAWNRTMADAMRQCHFSIIDKVHNEIPEFTRDKWVHQDSGSYVDPVAFKRRTINPEAFLHSRTILVKSNDLTWYDDATTRFFYEHLSSVARSVGAIAMIEPSVPMNELGQVIIDGNSAEAEANRQAVLRCLNLAKGICGFSSFYQTEATVNYLMEASGYKLVQYFNVKNEFKLVSGFQKIVVSNTNWSTLLNTGSTDQAKTNYLNKLASESMARISVRTIDDVSPAPVVTTTSGPTTTTAPVITTTVAPIGDYQARIQSQSFPDHINLSFVRSGNGWLITDTATPFLESGYEFSYFVNGYWLRLPDRMQNFFWPSNDPLSIVKCKTKLGLDTLNRWLCPSNGYYDCDAAKVFSYNNSFAYYNVIFNIVG